MALKNLLKIKFEGVAHEFFEALVGPSSDAEVVAEVYSLCAAAGLHLGTAMVQAALYQDDDAHEDCSLTACLNPLHPGPCKGWKGTLHEVSPGAWHALEAARVEKANHKRLQKIEALKSAGKPIPHKLLTPIVAKTHPNAGKTAANATGEAHAAGEAVSKAAGVHVNEPGKVTLGQAVKPIPLNTGEKGPKGKKPSVMSKGIAFVIAQDKVTPQYKLDKAAGITPEQWAGLSVYDKTVIRGELAKVKKDGFGPQQKKATELLDKLTIEQPKAAEVKAELNAAQKAVSDAFGVHGHLKSPEKKLAALSALSGEEFKGLPDKTQEEAKAWLKQLHKYNPELRKEVGAAMAKFTIGNAQAAWQKEADHPGYTPTMAAVGKYLLESGSLGKSKAGIYERLGTYKKLAPDEFHNLNAQEQAFVLHELSGMQKQAGKDSKIDGKLAGDLHAKFSAPKPASAEPAEPKASAPETVTVTTPSGKVYQKISLKEIHEGPNPSAASPVKAAQQAPKSATPKLADLNAGKAKFVGQKDSHGVVSKAKVGGESSSTSIGLPPGYKLSKDSMGYTLTYKPKGSVFGPKTIRTSSNQESLEKYAEDHHAAAALIIAKHAAAGTSPHFELSKLTPEKVAEHAKAPEPTKLSEIATPDTAVTTGGKPTKLQDLEAKAAEAKAKVEAHQAKPKLTETYTPKPKPLPAHVEHAIEMAKGQAPGASWSKNHLAAYQPLSAEEFDALPLSIRTKIVDELTKGQSKFLDPKKIQAAKDLLTKFGKGEGPKAAAPKIENVDFAKDLHSHNVTQEQAKQAVEGVGMPPLFAVAKQKAGLTDAENPDLGFHALNAVDDAKAAVEAKTKIHDKAVLDQPAVKDAVAAYQKAAGEQAYGQSVYDAKTKAFNKISAKLHEATIYPGALSPIEKAALKKVGAHVLSHPTAHTPAELDKLAADKKTAADALDAALHAATKQANAPKPADMSPAQIADRAKELLGPLAADPKVHLSLGELKHASETGKHQADLIAAPYPPGVVTDPVVAAKQAAVAQAAGQLQATQLMKAHLAEHVEYHHENALFDGTSINGTPLSAADKKVIAEHAQQLKASHAHLDVSQASQEAELAAAKDQFHAAALKAQDNLKPAEPNKLTEFDKATIHEAYAGAWGKSATKAVVHGIKTYGIKTQMKEHPEYTGFTQDLGNLRLLSGKVAVAHALERTAELNVPTSPETGSMEHGPEFQAWHDAVASRSALEKQFSDLHKTAQAKLDTIRTSVGLTKRALPKVDSPGVKTMAAETAYYKTGGYNGPLYGKSASAKQYLMAKVGPKLAVAHKTSSDKANEKYTKQATKAAEVAKSMPAPKVHAKPPSSEAGKGPNAESAASLGYHFTPKIAEGDQHGWPTSDNPAYVSSPEHLAELKQHLGSEDTKFGIAAQKEFKWSINNMEEKGSAHAGKAALYAYSGTSYDTINTKLNGLPPGAKSPGGQISSIDSAFAAAPPLEGDVVLYRGFKNPHTVFSSGKWNDVNVAGVEWSQRSYSSTSGALSTAQGFAGYTGGVVMRIIIPKEMGVKGINAKGGQHPGENEIILQRGIRYRVVADYGKRPSDGHRYIDVMVVPNPYDKSE